MGPLLIINARKGSEAFNTENTERTEFFYFSPPALGRRHMCELRDVYLAFFQASTQSARELCLHLVQVQVW